MEIIVINDTDTNAFIDRGKIYIIWISEVYFILIPKVLYLRIIYLGKCIYKFLFSITIYG